jgi:transcriptional regulator with XRE-family HTH domain
MTGEQLKQRRKELGLTQQEVADGLGISRERLSEWENGKFKISNAYVKLLESFFQSKEKK